MDSDFDVKRKLFIETTEENKIDIPKDFMEQFYVHYENRDNYYSIDDITNLVYSGQNDKNKRDQVLKEIKGYTHKGEQIDGIGEKYIKRISGENPRNQRGRKKRGSQNLNNNIFLLAHH